MGPWLAIIIAALIAMPPQPLSNRGSPVIQLPWRPSQWVVSDGERGPLGVVFSKSYVSQGGGGLVMEVPAGWREGSQVYSVGTFKYGLFRIEMRFLRVPYVRYAFFLGVFGEEPENEIDIIEIDVMGDGSVRLSSSVWWTSTRHVWTGVWPRLRHFNPDGYNNYTLLWFRGRVEFYVNDEKIPIDSSALSDIVAQARGMRPLHIYINAYPYRRDILPSRAGRLYVRRVIYLPLLRELGGGAMLMAPYTPHGGAPEHLQPLSMLLQYYGVGIHPHELGRIVGGVGELRVAVDTLNKRLSGVKLRYVDSGGGDVWRAIAAHIDTGDPVVLALKSGLGDLGLMVVGYRPGGLLIVHDTLGMATHSAVAGGDPAVYGEVELSRVLKIHPIRGLVWCEGGAPNPPIAVLGGLDVAVGIHGGWLGSVHPLSGGLTVGRYVGLRVVNTHLGCTGSRGGDVFRVVVRDGHGRMLLSRDITVGCASSAALEMLVRGGAGLVVSLIDGRTGVLLDRLVLGERTGI